MSVTIPMPLDLVVKCVEALPKWLRIHMEANPGWHCVAGGFCRDTIGGFEVKDIDVFSWGGRGLLEGCELAASKSGPPIITTRSHTYPSLEEGKPPVSFILDLGIPWESFRIEDFDFECCACQIDYCRGAWRGHMSAQCLEDIHAKRLTYTGQSAFANENGIGSMIRAVKFVRKGWNINTENLLKIGRFIQAKAAQNPHTYTES